MQLDVWMLKKSKCLADSITNTDRLRGGEGWDGEATNAERKRGTKSPTKQKVRGCQNKKEETIRGSL